MTKDAEDLQNGAVLYIMVPELLTSFENAIENVKNSDKFENAVRMAYMIYMMVCSTLEETCDIVIL